MTYGIMEYSLSRLEGILTYNGKSDCRCNMTFEKWIRVSILIKKDKDSSLESKTWV